MLLVIEVGRMCNFVAFEVDCQHHIVRHGGKAGIVSARTRPCTRRTAKYSATTLTLNYGRSNLRLYVRAAAHHTIRTYSYIEVILCSSIRTALVCHRRP